MSPCVVWAKVVLVANADDVTLSDVELIICCVLAVVSICADVTIAFVVTSLSDVTSNF